MLRFSLLLELIREESIKPDANLALIATEVQLIGDEPICTESAELRSSRGGY